MKDNCAIFFRLFLHTAPLDYLGGILNYVDMLKNVPGLKKGGNIYWVHFSLLG